MQVSANRIQFILSWAVIWVLAGCAGSVPDQSGGIRLVTPLDRDGGEHPVPFFLVYGWQHPYNRIGRVVAEGQGESERVFVDPQHSVIYSEKMSFTTERDTYTNLVYRVHFAKTPYSFIPFHFTAGNNPGVLVVITQDEESRPLLVTTVNTCGCYLTIIPTSYLPLDYYPDNWQEKEQVVYGEVLPARLEMSTPDGRLLISIRPAVHRIMDVQVLQTNYACSWPTIVADMQPLSSLKSLPLSDGRTTSMYYEQWPLRGHTKNAIKPLESLLLSLISLDLYVGMDKEYGSREAGANPFYTSLKPWNRSASDMNDFAGFLKFYGWKL